MPPLPNTLYTRDTTCWVYGGVTLNPLYWPARHDETLLYKALYTFHPAFSGAHVWWGDPERDWGTATLEGGDVMPIGNGAVAIGMSERTSRQAITRFAAALFAEGAAERVVVAGMPRLRSAMHLDTVFTLADRDLATAYADIVDGIHTFSLRPGDGYPVEVTEEKDPFPAVVADALGLRELRVLPTGGDAYESERQQRGRGGSRRGVRPRPEHDHQHPAAQSRRRGHHDRRRRARPRQGRWPLHDLPDRPRPGRPLSRRGDPAGSEKPYRLSVAPSSVRAAGRTPCPTPSRRPP